LNDFILDLESGKKHKFISQRICPAITLSESTGKN